jgi:hypothetical protein
MAQLTHPDIASLVAPLFRKRQRGENDIPITLKIAAFSIWFSIPTKKVLTNQNLFCYNYL